MGARTLSASLGGAAKWGLREVSCSITTEAPSDLQATCDFSHRNNRAQKQVPRSCFHFLSFFRVVESRFKGFGGDLPGSWWGDLSPLAGRDCFQEWYKLSLLGKSWAERSFSSQVEDEDGASWSSLIPLFRTCSICLKDQCLFSKTISHRTRLKQKLCNCY